jgi:CHAD domain-containing protein
VLRRLDADRQAEKTDLIAMLNQPRYEQLRTQLAAAACYPAFTEAAGENATDALAPVVRGRWKKIRRAVRKLGDNPPDEALHAVRVRAKQCRYAAEACAPALGKPARRLARSMAKVQDVLGEHHDAIVAGAWLAKTAHECSPAEAYAIGMLAQLEREAAAVARAEFPEVWRRADTERVRGWL